MQTVLILDDMRITVTILSRLVGNIGNVTVQGFTEPQLAMAWAEQHPVDLLLVDYHMPAMNGVEVIAFMKSVPRLAEVPIVVVTAEDNREVRNRALRAGAADYLTKPFDASEVEARIGNLLALRRSRRELLDRAEWLAREVDKATRALAARELELIERLSLAAEYRDAETGGHIVRMARYSELLARTLGLADDWCDRLRKAAPMHDIGKVGIPDAILLKPGRLTGDEQAVMRRHADFGREILDGSSSDLIQMAAEIAAGHHEKWDGTGYPAGLAGTAIPLSARIVAVADVFDALTSARPYKRPWPVADALAFLAAESGRHFDPACVAAFLACRDRVLQIMAAAPDLPAGPLN